MDTLPVYSTELIKQLNESYPVILPKPGVCKETEIYKAGQRSVIDTLLNILKEQEDNILS